MCHMETKLFKKMSYLKKSNLYSFRQLFDVYSNPMHLIARNRLIIFEIGTALIVSGIILIGIGLALNWTRMSFIHRFFVFVDNFHVNQ